MLENPSPKSPSKVSFVLISAEAPGSSEGISIGCFSNLTASPSAEDAAARLSIAPLSTVSPVFLTLITTSADPIPPLTDAKPGTDMSISKDAPSSSDCPRRGKSARTVPEGRTVTNFEYAAPMKSLSLSERLMPPGTDAGLTLTDLRPGFTCPIWYWPSASVTALMPSSSITSAPAIGISSASWTPSSFLSCHNLPIIAPR